MQGFALYTGTLPFLSAGPLHKESLVKAEIALEMEKRNKIDALREVQDRLDQRLDESVAIDSQLLSKS